MKIVWSRRAIQQLEHVREFIAADQPAAARAITESVIEAVEALSAQAHLGRPGRVVGTRELVVTGTPYILPYRVRTGRVEIIGVFHGRQKWPKRL
jgi:toxin ParE1/3/4